MQGEKTVTGNRSYRGEIPFTNTRVISRGLGLGERKSQTQISVQKKSYKKSIITLKPRKEMFGTNTVNR